MPFGLEDYEAIADALRTIKGRAVVSLNDHPDMRRVFAAFPMESVDTTYTVGGNPGGHDRSADRRELVIFSWDRKPSDGGLFDGI